MDLPNEFDVIILGTGMPESVVAAAFSRIGQSVLHLDRNDHYSGGWASFNLQGIEKWVEEHKVNGDVSDCLIRPTIDEASILGDGERLVEMPLNNTCFSNAQSTFNASDDEEEEDANVKAETRLDKDVSSLQIAPQDHTNSEQIVKSDSSIEAKAIDKVNNSGSVEDAAEDKDDNNTSKDEDTKQINEDVKSGDTESGSMDSCLEMGKDGVENEDEIPCVKEDQLDNDVKGEGDVKKLGDDKKVENKPKKWTVNRIKLEWRRFNIDLSPKVLFSVGEMVSLLIESDIAKYCEFKTVTQILTLLEGIIEKVPCSRADVFSSKRVSMLEKRMLMKFIQFCLDYENKQEEITDNLDKPFTEFLASRKLTPTIQHYIQHSIAMATDSMTTKQGLEQMKKFLVSLGRYGNTAFLWSLYGSGELPQSFCRMCAVFGGVYCLRTTASSIILDTDNKCTGIVTTDGQKIKCKWLIMESSYAPSTFVTPLSKKTISRGIFMTDKPLLTVDQQEQLSLMCLPCPDDGDRPVFVLQLPPSSMTAPQGIYISHLTRQGAEGVTPQDDLSYAVKKLFPTIDTSSSEEGQCKVLWSVYFTQDDMSEVQPSESIPDNVVLVSGPGTDIDIDRPVTEGKNIFKKIMPDEEFLPKAPNPEDIIFVDDAEAQVADGNSQSEFSEQTSDQSEATAQDGSTGDQSECSERTAPNQSDVQDEKSDIQSDLPSNTDSLVAESNVPSEKASE